MPQKTFNLIKLHFKAPLHISSGKEEYGSTNEILPSDALKSAIFAASLQLYGDEANEDFFRDFKVSSAFPFFKDEYFFPKPFVKLPFAIKEHQNEEAVEAKMLKKVRYLGKNFFEETLRKGNAENDKRGLSTDNIPKDPFLTDHPDREEIQKQGLFKKEQHPRVAIPPWDSADETDPFYMEKLYFRENCGLFFALEAHDESLKKAKSALRLLADQGIGSDRNVGNGHFTFEEAELSLQVPEDGTHQVALSLFCPQKEEINDEFLNNSNYELMKRGGYLASPKKEDFMSYRKKSVFMFSEGSIFPDYGLNGKYVDLKPEVDNGESPDHPVWRDGRPITLPIKVVENA